MKKIVFAFMLFIPMLCYSQKIIDNKTDGFTGKKFITTSWCDLTSSWTKVVRFRFRYDNGDRLFDLIYRNGISGGIDKGNTIDFKSVNGNITSYVNSRYITVIDYDHIEPITFVCNDDSLMPEKITIMRVHFNKGYDDFEISKKYQDRIYKSYKLLMETIKQ